MTNVAQKISWEIGTFINKDFVLILHYIENSILDGL